MDDKAVIQSQYYAALKMLEAAIRQCPDALWSDPECKNRFWHIAYHKLFCTHLYLQASEKEFTAWEKHRKEYEFLGPLPWPPHKEPDIGEPYTKDEMLEFVEFCQAEVERNVSALNLEAESGFFWLPFGKLELQFYNIRHVQHHAGQLIDRLRNKESIGVDWAGMKTQQS
ncbi:DinB family protein [Candidatus Sumerlaeota bacterium]|nr:DinB family protein [Candidatus Sumerlaeota bacterium]